MGWLAFNGTNRLYHAMFASINLYHLAAGENNIYNTLFNLVSEEIISSTR